MSLSRREWVVVSLSTLIGGCAAPSVSSSHRPGPSWPSAGPAPARPINPAVAHRVAAPAPAPAVATPFTAMPRSKWAKAGPIGSRLGPMNGINRITLHHEGYKPVYFSEISATMERLDLIRRSHLSRMKAGDIGYHYVIDRAGRIWEGRPVQYQGAHAGGANNRHNLGIMMLGNFDEQSPSEAQMKSMVAAVQGLQQVYSVPTSKVYSHQELSPTRCPGTNLQPRFAALRHNGTFA